MLRFVVALLAALGLGLGLVACGGSPTEEETMSADVIIIDVRTPEEYASGHLDGARLLDLNGGQFAAELPNLDPDAEYAVYCRSGNRSGQAVAMMTEAGFSQVTNLGSLEQAAESTGIAIVK